MKTVYGLAFSGGKDSLACWYLTRHLNPIVIWVNTGKAYPETLKIIDTVRKASKNFVEVHSDKESQNMCHGLPSDIVPINFTSGAKLLTGQKEVKVQSYLRCCYENISFPLLQAMQSLGVTDMIRGQRNNEDYKGAVRDGDIVADMKVIHPIENWTSADVIEYLKGFGEIPEHFKLSHSSMDCYDCTAYLHNSMDRLIWTKERHPEKYNEYQGKLF